MQNTQGHIVKGNTHEECNSDGKCGEKYTIAETGEVIELEEGEAVIIPDSFDVYCFADSYCKSPIRYKMTGTIKQIASLINTIGGGSNFSPGGKVWKNQRIWNNPKLTYRNKKRNPSTIKTGSVVINRTNMKNPQVMTFEGTTYEIASSINSFGGNGVELSEQTVSKLEEGGLIDKSLVEVPETTKYFTGIHSKYKNPYEINRAIEEYILTKTLDFEDYWNEDEKVFIGQYSGYGGLEKQGSFSDSELKRLLYEFYTPDEVVKKMWALAYLHGYGLKSTNPVLDPAVGIGAFLKYAPGNEVVHGFDINKYAVIISNILYPSTVNKIQSFEELFIHRNKTIGKKTNNLLKYSLVIGNPPYGKLGGQYIGMGEGKFTKAANWNEYFITRGLDLLEPNGLLIYIVGAEQKNGGTLFLDSGITPAKEEIFKKAMLVDAYRLPTNLFERTGVSSEIVVFKKK